MGDTALLQLFPVTGLQLCAALIAEQCIVRDGRAALRAGLAGRLGGLFRGSFFCLLHGGFVVHLGGLGRGQSSLQAGISCSMVSIISMYLSTSGWFSSLPLARLYTSAPS